MSVELPTRSMVSTRTGHDASTRRLLAALHELAGRKADLVIHAERAWASITFTGTRHVIEYHFDGQDAVECGESFIARLPEHEFDIPGYLVADATVTQVEHHVRPQPHFAVTCEVLMLEEA